MAKEYHYIVKYSDNGGWQIDPDTEEAKFPDGTIYDHEAGEWQFGYLGDGEYNGKEEDLGSLLSSKLSELNEDTRKKNG